MVVDYVTSLHALPSRDTRADDEGFEVTIPVAGGASVVVRVVDGNDRQMDNDKPGIADRMQLIEGVTEKVLDGQMLRLDVLGVAWR